MTQNLSSDAERKRLEIGLSARRETARTVIMRPPDVEPARSQRRVTQPSDWQNHSPSQESAAVQPATPAQNGWWLVFLTGLLTSVTFLLVAARFLGAPTDLQQINRQVSEWSAGSFSLPSGESIVRVLRLPAQWVVSYLPDVGTTKAITADTSSALDHDFYFRDDFSRPSARLRHENEPERWQLTTLPSEGVYRMQVRPKTGVWSTLGERRLEDYWLQSSVLIASETRWGIAGVVARFQDADNFYLFQIDGAGEYRVLLRSQGQWQMLQTWEPSERIQRAGQPNQISLNDDGQGLRFSLNNSLLFQVPAPMLPAGDVGLWASDEHGEPATVDFDWVEVSTNRS